MRLLLIFQDALQLSLISSATQYQGYTAEIIADIGYKRCTELCIYDADRCKQRDHYQKRAN